MSRGVKQLVSYTCDMCGNNIRKNDKKALLGVTIPIFREKTRKNGKTTSGWEKYASSDLCQECSRKVFTAHEYWKEMEIDRNYKVIRTLNGEKVSEYTVSEH